MTQDSIRTIVARIEERQISISDKVDEIKSDFKEHTENDEHRFEIMRQELGSINKQAASIAVVAGAIGFGASYAWKFLTGKL